MPSEIEYSDRYYDNDYEYRHVTLPRKMISRLPSNRLMQEDEWRRLGVQQSAGWMHYAIHKPEPHVLLFKRPKHLDTLPKEKRDEWKERSKEILREKNEALKNQYDTYSTRQSVKENKQPCEGNGSNTSIDFDRLFY